MSRTDKNSVLCSRAYRLKTLFLLPIKHILLFYDDFSVQDLKYSPEENTPEELARTYKEEGNFHFKTKKYRLAVASYTEGVRQKCESDEINTQLITNRAAAQWHLGNYRYCRTV